MEERFGFTFIGIGLNAEKQNFLRLTENSLFHAFFSFPFIF